MQNHELLIQLLENVNKFDISIKNDKNTLNYLINWLKIHSILQKNYKNDENFSKLDVEDQKTIQNLLNKFQDEIIPNIQLYIQQLKKLQKKELNDLFLSHYMDFTNQSEENSYINPAISRQNLFDSLFFLSIFQLVVAPAMIKIARSKILDKITSLPQKSEELEDIFLPNMDALISNESINPANKIQTTPIKTFFDHVGSDLNKWFIVQKNNVINIQKKIEENSNHFMKSIEKHLEQAKQTIKSKQIERKKKRIERRKNIQLDLRQKERQRDQDLLYQFKNVMRISQRIKRNDVARALSIPESELLQRLIQWGDQYPFKINKDEIIVEDLTKFVSVLDNQFEEWENLEQVKNGKI
ncbi:hypothetical protein NEF87_002415 [Candidatus Lokiarchaeum ossiferum]|uniref:Uncharacterized protein n=1 Tax=Candidatus Lokiarchaeum ossiferum TaxID=2951803 RepID=A0ABY6HRU9_9ARCH|nr:hypothetical protein NEF87_002415 [Candidatus Lokiarchaeum sp. B-35]